MINSMSVIAILETWFLENKRSFPWRENKNPYRVWISEVMLQQTRASVVVPYFERWMQLFPNVKALYNASLDQVIKAWEGLGYYSRARNLHAAATEIVERFSGDIPSSYEELMSIRGFGPYTAGAVLNFGFHKKAIAIDGNVLRVISRYFLIEERVDRTSARRLIEDKVDSLLNGDRPWIVAEALIELGATVCLPKPRCEMCPLQESCLARKMNKAELLPLKKIKEKTVQLFRFVMIFEHEGHVLVKKRDRNEVMADLYEFPYIEVDRFPIRLKKMKFLYLI